MESNSSSPPPNMYDTSTSESSRTSHGYSQSKQQQQQQSRSLSSKAAQATTAHNNNGNAGAFKSQAVLLASPQQHPSPSRAPRSSSHSSRPYDSVSEVSAPASFPSAAAHYVMSQQPQQQHRSSSHVGAGYPMANTTSGSSSRLLPPPQKDTTSIMTGEMSSTAAPTITTQHTTYSQSEPGASSYSQLSYYTNLTDHYSSSGAPSSAASPEKRRFSARFSNLNTNSNHEPNNNNSSSGTNNNRYEMARQQRAAAVATEQQSHPHHHPNSQSFADERSFSQQPLLTSRQQQQQQQHVPSSGTNYPASPRHTQQQQQQQHSSLSRHTNPFTSPPSSQRSGSSSKGKAMSVSERIKRFSHNAHTFPDPEPTLMNMEDDTSDALQEEYQQHQLHNQQYHNQQQQQQQQAPPLSPFYHGQPTSGRRRRTTIAPTHSTTNVPSPFQKPRDGISRTEAVAAVREQDGRLGASPNDNYIHNSSPNTSHNTSHEYLPTSASSSRPEFAPPEGAAASRGTSLPPVRRRKPLQQPAYNPQQEHQPQQQEQPEVAMVQQEQDTMQPPIMGSPGRVQDLKRQLWSPDEKLNVSLDHSQDSEANRRASARSLSPRRQHRHSTGSMMRPPPSNNNATNSNNGNVGGFKSKFYQAAMAAQRGGERPTSPPRSRGLNHEGSPPVHQVPSKEQPVPGTPPRPHHHKVSRVQSQAQRLLERTAALTDYPTPPRPSAQQKQQQSVIQATTAMPPTPPHHSHARITSISPNKRSRSMEAPPETRLQQPSLSHAMSQPNQAQQQEQQAQLQGSFQATQPYVNKGNSSPPMTKEGTHYISKLVAKLSAVSRDDPQAALAQIDSILRAESHKSASSNNQEMADHHAMLMNAAAAAVGIMPPQNQEELLLQPQPTQLQDHPGQHHSHNPHHQQQHHHHHPEAGNHAHHAGNADEDDSDDDTSVSTITNPTYRSSMPTHEQLHDVPPPRGISTATYRRPRPNGLQSYNTPAPTPAIAGLELVQRHHSRQMARKGHRDREAPGHAHPHNNQAHQHLPPMTINVSTGGDDNGMNPSGQNAFTENLIKSSSNKPQYKNPSRPQYEAGEAPPLEQEKLEQKETMQKRIENQEQQLQNEAANEPTNRQSSNHDTYGFPMESTHPTRGSGQQQQQATSPGEISQHMQAVKQSSPEGSGTRSSPAKEAPATSTPPQEKKSNNPFDDSLDLDDGLPGDSEKPRFTMSSTSKERKLDLFMSKKKKREEGQLLEVMEQHEQAQLTSNALTRKIRSWDGSPSADGSERMGPSSQASAAGSSRGGSVVRVAREMAAVNVSTATLSLGAASSASKSTRKSHPWDGEKRSSKMKIDFRDTSMDNALGVEAECFSQSQASPARDLRAAARMNHQQQQIQMRGAAGNDRGRMEDQVSPARELRKERLARAAMQRQGGANDMPVQFQESTSPSQTEPSLSEGFDADSAQDRGFEVTPIYATATEQHGEAANVSNEPKKGDWVALPSNSFFDASKRSQSKVVATLVDEDSQPVTMVRAPELPAGVTDAFAKVPVPYDERPPRNQQSRRSSSLRRSGDVADVSGIHETPPPVPSGSNSTNRGRRGFANFLKKKRANSSAKKSAHSPSPRKPSLASAMVDHSRGDFEPESQVASNSNNNHGSSTRGRRTASKSPAPLRNRTRSLDDSSRNRNPNMAIAKKFSRLLKVYGNDIDD